MSLIFPISISTFIDVAKPTINAPGAALATESNMVSLIMVAGILAIIPTTKAIIKNTADNSLMYQPQLKTPIKMTIKPIINVDITNQLFRSILYSLNSLDSFNPSTFKPFDKLDLGFSMIFLKYLTL